MTINQKWGAYLSGVFILLLFWLFSLATKPLSAQTSAVDQTLLSSASSLHPVEVFSVNAAANIVEAFAAAGKEYYPEDRISFFPDPSLGLGTVITAQRALPVTVVDGKKTKILRSWEKTAGDFLKEKKIGLGDEDRITPALGTPLELGTTITIIRVARTTVKEKEVIPFQTKIEKDYHQFVGPATIVTAGKNGEREKTYLVIREDGELVSKTLVASTLTRAPRQAVVRQGGLNPVPSHCRSLKDWVVDASLKNKIDPNSLYYRILRESNCHPNSQAGSGHQGLFQYDPNWWSAIAARAGFTGASIWDAKAQIYVTAWAWANGYRSRWPIP